MDIAAIADDLRRHLVVVESWEHTSTEGVTDTEVIMGFIADDGTPVSLALNVTE